MKLLLNYDKVVSYAGNVDYEITTKGTTVKAGNTTIAFYPDFKTGNCESVDVLDNQVPQNVIGQYKYVDNLFVKNTQYIKPVQEEVQLLTELISSEIPKQYDATTIEKKVNKIIERWQSFFKDNRLEVTDVPADIQEGILNIYTPDEQLTPEQLINKKKALNLKYKLTARYRIEAEIGDIPDQIADIDKLVNMLTGMIVRMYNKLFKNIDPPADIKENYDTYTTLYTQLIDSGQYKDTSDIQDIRELTHKQVHRRGKSAEIVETEYLSKKIDPLAGGD